MQLYLRHLLSRINLTDKSTERRGLRRRGLKNGRFEFDKLEDRVLLAAGTGLLGQYYANPNLTNLNLVRVDASVNFNWGFGSYAASGGSDLFSVRWSGQVEAQFTQSYSFIVNADDGARLWVNGQSLIDRFDDSSVINATATIDLIAGRRYDIQLEYRESTGNALVKLEWSSASLPREVVPASRLFASQRGSITSEKWNGITGSAVSNLTGNSNYPNSPSVVSELSLFEAVVNSGDNFGQRLRGYVHAPQTGPYTFYIAADESAELWLSNSADSNQKQLIATVNTATSPRQWTAFPSQKSSVVYLAAGQSYYIEALHKEATGADHLAVAWLRPNSFVPEVISGDYLTPQAQTVRIFSKSPNVAEGATSPASFTVVRSGTPINNSLTVNYSLSGAATNGVDYQWLSGTITIPAGSRSIDLNVLALNDGLIEGDESVVVELKSGAGYVVGLQSERTVYGKIQDDILAPPGGTALLAGSALNNFTRFGATFTTVNDPIAGSVIQAVVPVTSNNPWSIQLKQNIVGPVAAGDILLVEFRIRSVGGAGKIAAIFEKSSAPNTKSLDQGLPTSDDWIKVQLPFVSKEAYAAGAASFGFFLGYQAQTLRFADIRVVNYGPAKTLAPENSFFLNNIGGSYGVSEILPVANQPFATAYRVTTTSVPLESWRLQAVARNTAAVKNGDNMRFQFYARAIAGTTPSTQFVLQNTSVYANLYSQTISLTSNWQLVTINFSSTANYGIEGLQAVFNLGQRLQTVEIGGFRWTNQNNLFDLADLPSQFPASTYNGRVGTDDWRQGADDRISDSRKSNVTINVNDMNGQPLSGAVVSLRQSDHAFHFGSAISAFGSKLDPNGTPTALKYQSEIKRLFNTVVFENSLKWPSYLQDPQRAITGVNWATINEFYVRGHNLIWPSRNNMPTSVWSEYDTRVANNGLAAANVWLDTTIDMHFDSMLTQFDGLISEWDVVNEPWSNNDVMNILGNSILIDWFQRVRNFDPSIKLTLNDYGIFASNGANTSHRTNFEGWLGLLQAANLLDVIGEQSHYSDSSLTDIAVLGQLISSYHTQFNAPIAITEFDVNTKDEQLQADYLRDYMTMSFSQTAVTEFLHWGFWESSHWLPSAALYRFDFSIKPNGQAYEDLVFGRWWTDMQATTRGGEISTSAFLGNYDVLVEYNGQTYTSTMSVDASGNSTLVLNLPVNAINYNPMIRINNGIVSGNVASIIANTGLWSEPENEAVVLSSSLGTVAQNNDGTWSWAFTPEQRFANQVVTITATDARGGSVNATFTINAQTAISGRNISYGGSSAFGQTIALGNKTALRPGQTATFANYTSYELGLNRVVVDVAGLASNSISAADFEFRVGNNNDPNSWMLLDSTSSIPLPTISVSAPDGGISRVVLTWPDNKIQNRWLQVVVKATVATGLNVNDVFYFGNAIGETGNDINNAVVNLQDVAATRSNQSGFATVPISNNYDFDRDGRVNLVDLAIVRLNQSGFFDVLNLITVPGSGNMFGSIRTGEGGSGKGEWMSKFRISAVDRGFANFDGRPAIATKRSSTSILLRTIPQERTLGLEQLKFEAAVETLDLNSPVESRFQHDQMRVDLYSSKDDLPVEGSLSAGLDESIAIQDLAIL